MITVEELNAIKDKYKYAVTGRTDEKKFLVEIGMGNSGLVAGAREIMLEIVRLVDEYDLSDKVRVMQKAKASVPGHNPIVKVYDGRELTVYADVTKEIADAIIKEQIMNGRIPQEYVFNAEEE